MPFVDSIEQDILDHFVGNSTWTAPTSVFVGLSTTTPTGSGTNVTEPSTGSYARVEVADTAWGDATGTAPASVSNSSAVTFTTATADWASGSDLTHFVLFDASTSGNVIAFGALADAKPVLSGDTASFAIGALVLKLGASTDTFT